MSVNSIFNYIKQLRVKPGSKVNLKKFDTDIDQKMVTKEEGDRKSVV